AATISAPELAAAAELAAQTRLTVVPERKEFALALLRPAAVALIGVVNDPDDAHGRPLQLLRRHGFAGEIYPVSASRRQVQGVRAWPAISALPGPVDQALILADGDTAIDAVEACGRARIPVAVMYGQLPRDEAQPGTNSDERLLAAAHRHDVRILGPSSAGLVVPASGFAFTTEPAFAARTPANGRLM